MAKLKINGLMDDDKIAWKKIPCKCDKSDPEKCHPISRLCKHCCCQQAQDSMPRNTFDKKCYTLNDKGEITKTETKTVTEITICRSNDGYDSIIGWGFDDP